MSVGLHVDPGAGSAQRARRGYLRSDAKQTRKVLVQTKQTVRDLLDRPPDECTLQDVLYHLSVLSEIEEEIEELDAGRGVPHEQVEREPRRKWRLGAESSGLLEPRPPSMSQ